MTQCPGTHSPTQQGSWLLAEGTARSLQFEVLHLSICFATVKKYLFVMHLCQPRSSQEKVKCKSTRFSAGKRGEVMEELGEGARGKPASPPPRLNQEGLVVFTQRFGALPCPCACGWSCWWGPCSEGCLAHFLLILQRGRTDLFSIPFRSSLCN